MITIYYKDNLNLRQNLPFINYFKKKKENLRVVSKVSDIELDRSEMNFIFVGTMEFYEVCIRYLFNRNVRIIYRSRGVAPEESYYRNRSKIRFLILSLLEYFVIKISSHTVVVTNNHKTHYINKYKIKPEKISVVHNYLNSDEYNNKPLNSINKEVVYVGGLSKWQNINDVKNMFAKLSIMDEDITFLICTSIENIEKAKSVFKDVKRINYESYKDYDELIARISKTAAGVILRDDNIVNICASPFKIIDYFVAQVPIIMTNNIGDYPTIITGKKFVYEIDNLDYTDVTIKEIKNFINEMYLNHGEVKLQISKFSQDNLNAELEIDKLMSILIKENGE
jgi:glycosyltransferase involved in cell wall biosynthesis